MTATDPKRARPAGTDTPPPAGQLRPDPPLTVVRPGNAWTKADVLELWRSRELLANLTVRDIKLRYAQTVLGVGWAVFQPLATVMVFVVFIGWMGGAAAGVDNYVLYVLAGVIPWTFFAAAVGTAANSILANERLVTKTYFPRLHLPLSCVGAAAFDLVIGLVGFGLVMACYGVAPAETVIFAPLVLGMIALTAVGFGTLLAALIVAQRDFRHLLTFGMQLWMFATPCIYLVPERVSATAQRWAMLNPLHGLIGAFRSLALGTPLDWPALLAGTLLGLLALAAGLVYFRRVERTMADTI